MVTVVEGDARDGGPGGQPGSDLGSASPSSLPVRLRALYARRVGPAEKSLLLSWAEFSATFGAVRAVTHVLRRRDLGSGGSGGIVIAGRHLPHYNLGILLLGGVGGVAVHGQDHHRRHSETALGYGLGAALVVDELALLLDLSDVHWASDGRTIVDAAVGVIGVGGLLLAAAPLFGGAAREVLRTRPATK